jgi:ATP-binding cassette subfamily B protein
MKPRAKRRRLRTIPYVRQKSWNECGLACLQMVLEFHGKPASREELVGQLNLATAGITALDLLATARRCGLRGRGIRIPLRCLSRLPRGAILHWKPMHYVVFDRKLGRSVRIVDPEVGRRSIPIDLFERNFSGVALSFRAPRD